MKVPCGGKRGGILALLVTFLVIGLVVCVWILGANHLVKTREGFKYYPKAAFGWTDTFVDITEWRFTNMREHQGLVKAMIDRGDARLLPGGETLEQLLKLGIELTDVLERIPEEARLNEVIEEIRRTGEKKLDLLEERLEKGKEALREGADNLKDWLKKK